MERVLTASEAKQGHQVPGWFRGPIKNRRHICWTQDADKIYAAIWADS